MTVRPDYALSRARYTAFLFTVVGTETRDAPNSGEDITVLTALTRIGIDPWEEAARLAVLPRAEAAQSLAATFINLPDTLPPLSHRPSPPLGSGIFLTWRFWAAGSLVLALVALNYMVNRA